MQLQSTPAAAMETMTGGPVESEADQLASQQLLDEVYEDLLEKHGGDAQKATEDMVGLLAKNISPEKAHAIKESHEYASAALREEMAQKELREFRQ
jgi:hypothetical protein